jgi:hypothetical protein
MSYEQPEVADTPASKATTSTDSNQGGASTRDRKPSGIPQSQDDSTNRQATVLVRGETIREPDSTHAKDSPSQEADKTQGKAKSAPKQVSDAKLRMQKNLPALDDDAESGIQKDQIVTRDGTADLAFTGTLIASAAPSSAPKGEWQEYRIYETSGGKHVFSKVTRNVLAEEQDSCEAEVFDPSPSSMPSQLLRSARDLTRSHPLTWSDAAVAFFRYDPLAKVLYRKLSGEFEEHIG